MLFRPGLCKFAQSETRQPLIHILELILFAHICRGFIKGYKDRMRNGYVQSCENSWIKLCRSTFKGHVSNHTYIFRRELLHKENVATASGFFLFWSATIIWGGVGELISDYTSCSNAIFPIFFISCTKDWEKHFPFEWCFIQQNTTWFQVL